MSLHAPNSDSIPFYTTRLNIEDLFSHVAVLGQPGSGKSRACVKVLVQELVKLNSTDRARKPGMFCVDGKGGGELRHHLETALKQAGRLDDLVVVGPHDVSWNPFGTPDWTDASIATTLMDTLNTIGGSLIRRSPDPFWDNTGKDLLTALVSVAQHLRAKELQSQIPFHVGFLTRLRPILSKSDEEIIRTAIDLSMGIPPESASALLEFATLPSNTRHCVASGVGTILSAFARTPLKDVLIPDSSRPQLDMTQILSEGRVVLFDLSSAQDVLELLPAAILAKLSFAKMILARRRTDTNQDRPVFAIFEEFQRVMTPQTDSPGCEANWMDTCRSAGCGVIFTTQGVSSLMAKASPFLVDTIMSLASTQMWLASSDPAAIAYATRCLPTKTKYRSHRTISFLLPPPLLFPRDNESPNHTESRTLVPVKEPMPLEKLSCGMICLKKRHGSVVKIQADLSKS